MTGYLRKNYRSFLGLLALAAFIWVVFGPVQLGGKVAYVIIRGNSMEPDFTLGDLVLTRKSTSYDLGDRVVYEHPQVGYVFHKIVDKDQTGFILKGDNNDWLDSFQPDISDIVGRYWFMIPGAGNLIVTLRKPAYFTGLVILIASMAGLFLFFQKDDFIRDTTRRKRPSMNTDKSSAMGDFRQDQLLILGIIAVAALVFGIFAFTRPLKTQVVDDVMYTHQVDLDYFAPDLSGIYDSAEIKTGDPVFTSLNCIVDLKISYRFSSPRLSKFEASAFRGSYRVRVKLSDIDGWNRTFLLHPETKFAGVDFEAWTLLDICHLQSLISEKEAKTNTENRLYSLTLYPDIDISGSLNGLKVIDTYQSEVSFQLDSNMMRLQEEEQSPAYSSTESIKNFREIDNFIFIFGRMLDIKNARWLAAIVFGLSFLGAIYPGWSLYAEIQKSTAARFRIQHRALLIDVEKGTLKKEDARNIAVGSFLDLVKIAERYGAVILHEVDGSIHRYSVQDQGSMFQFSAEDAVDELDLPKSGARVKAKAQAKSETAANTKAQPINKTAMKAKTESGKK